MKSFYYRPGRNAALALAMGAFALLCGWTWWRSGGWMLLGGTLLLGAAMAKAAHNALNSEPALRLDPRKLTVRTTFGSQEVPWHDVQSISLETVSYRYYGIIRMGSVQILCIAAAGGLTGTRRFRLSAATIDVPAGGAVGLLMQVQAAHLAAVGEAGVAMAGAGSRGWGVGSAGVSDDSAAPASGFDPDAAIARYLAAKQAGEGTERKVAEAERPVRAMQRPTFGRRTA